MVIMKILISVSILVLGWKLVKLREPDYASGIPEAKKRMSCVVAVFYMLLAACVQPEEIWQEAVIYSLFWASMALCAWCDYLTTEIYDFCYLPAFISGCLMLWLNSAWYRSGDLIIFAVIQFLIFRKLIGTSDCVAFWICALYLAGTGKGFEAYVWFMAYVYVLFLVAQLLFGNVDKKIKLKEPKPMIPYIAVVILWVGI